MKNYIQPYKSQNFFKRPSLIKIITKNDILSFFISTSIGNLFFSFINYNNNTFFYLKLNLKYTYLRSYLELNKYKIFYIFHLIFNFSINSDIQEISNSIDSLNDVCIDSYEKNNGEIPKNKWNSTTICVFLVTLFIYRSIF